MITIPDGNQIERLWEKAQQAGMTRRKFLELLGTGGAVAVMTACTSPVSTTASPVPNTPTQAPNTATPVPNTPSPVQATTAPVRTPPLTPSPATPAPVRTPTAAAPSDLRREILWNQFRTDEYEGMLAETTAITGHKGDIVRAYFSRPLGKGPFPGVILIAHAPGWDEFYREASRRFSHHGYLAICPDIFGRFGVGTPEEVVAKARAAGGVPDDSVLGDCEGSMKYLRTLPYSNGKVGVIGTCSGGRHSFLAACRVNGLNAAVECWGSRVVASKEELTPAQPVAPIDYTDKLACPLLGVFGNDDRSPSPEQVNRHEEELKKFGKNYKFYRYDGAGHGFWYYHGASYRPQQAMDSWNKVFEFFGEHLRS